MGNWGTEWVTCCEQGWECKEQDGNFGTENQQRNARNLSGNENNVGNEGGDASKQGGISSIPVEMT